MKIAFVIDNPEFKGGAHVATKALIEKLRADGHQVDIVSPNFPKLGSFRFRVRQILGHLHIGWFPDWTIDPKHKIRRLLATYDTVCCLGEPSSCRKLVSNLPSYVRKVILIHTDYSTWRNFSPLAKEMSRFDRWWYARYDCIGVVGVENAKKMAIALPKLTSKIKPFHNIFYKEPRTHVIETHEVPRIVTLMRVGDPPKKSERYLNVVKHLKDCGIRFDWYVYGDGEQLENYRTKCITLGIDDCLHFDGYTTNVMDKLSSADLMVMLSVYEGLPNTIYESFLCETPVFSTNVGGIAEQIKEGKNGWIVENKEQVIVERLKFVLTEPKLLIGVSQNLRGYKYNNDIAYRELCDIIGICLK